MNRTKIKNYAPQARRDMLQAVTDRAAFYGLTAERIEPVKVQGDVAIIGGRAFPREIGAKRKALQERVERDGFGPTMEALSYTWFNRLVAIRYMELHGYFEHGYRVLSNPDPARSTPEILDQAEHVELPDLNRERVVELKLDGAKEAELYRMLLGAQCNALHSAMPFLFERIGDETELVLPEGLLHSDSIVRKLVSGIDEEDWQAVEIIGWLYQFYISEKKDEVIGKVVASEDIPAATQLFTPNWIVKYLVQNTLGRQWLATYPQSALRQQMQYYIEPAVQTPEVQEQLKAITPTSLNPEELTLLDPACGSGHILVEAYDLFKAIYQERGYRAKDIPALILQKNLFGLEIDDRAAQLAAFALMMKARADDRRIFDSEAKPNVVALQDSQGMNAADLTLSLNAPVSKEDVPTEYLFEEIQEEKDGLFSKKALAEKGFVSQGDIANLLALFENAKTFGSLIQIPPKLAAKLPEIEKRLADVLKYGDLTHASAHVLRPFLQQARLLARQYDAVVANPPYMGSKFFNTPLKDYIGKNYKDAKADLCVAFIERGLDSCKPTGLIGFITMQSWMFLSSFENFRVKLMQNRTMRTMIHLGPHAFPEIGGQVVQVTAFTVNPQARPEYRGSYKRLIEGQSHEKEQRFNTAKPYTPSNADFAKIPASPVAYWASDKSFTLFAGPALGLVVHSEGSVKTGNNSRYIRCHWEVAFLDVGQANRWRKHPRGGDYRKWYGNVVEVVDWSSEARQHYRADHVARIPDERYWDIDGICWSEITISSPSFRVLRRDEVANNKSLTIYTKNGTARDSVLAFLNTSVAKRLLFYLNPTIGFGVGDVLRLPWAVTSNMQSSLSASSVEAVTLARTDWDFHETSWDFVTLPVLHHKQSMLRASQEAADAECVDRFTRMKKLEEDNNRLFIEAYGLQDELSPEVPDDQITLYRPDRAEDIKRLISYAIGCMMGRYSLDKPGLIYAHSSNLGFDPNQHKTFRADDDGIIPLLETDWGIRDDATNRIVEFIGVAWPKEHLEENLKFVADSLGPNNGEQSRETIRRYVATAFYKHHLSMYKKRPIYWLFSSGKQRAFQCLVYLHRYHEGTLARMRTEYVIPLQGQIAARIEQLEGDKAKATSTSHRRKLQKEQDNLKKQQAELLIFEEKLKHAADQRISLDLDDGVKVNYGKFGDLLAEVKAVTGGKEED